VNVRLSRLNAELYCPDVKGRSGQVLNQAAFAPEATYRVKPGEALPLGPLDEDIDSTETPCGAVTLQILGQRDLAVFWGASSASSEKLASLSDPTFRDHAVRLEGTKGLERLAVGASLEGSEPRTNDGVIEPPRVFGWSGRVMGVAKEIARRDVLPDGCLSIGDTGGPSGTALYLCVPDWAFPFQVGDRVVATSTAVDQGSLDAGATRTDARRLVVQDAETSPTRVLEIWLDVSPSVVSASGELLSDQGHFTSCGAYVEQLAVTLFPGLPVRGALAPGDLAEYTDGIVRTRVLMGRTERVLVAPSGCEPARSSLNFHFDLLTLRTPEGASP
jgi:hypothetical protein